MEWLEGLTEKNIYLQNLALGCCLTNVNSLLYCISFFWTQWWPEVPGLDLKDGSQGNPDKSTLNSTVAELQAKIHPQENRKP